MLKEPVYAVKYKLDNENVEKIANEIASFVDSEKNIGNEAWTVSFPERTETEKKKSFPDFIMENEDVAEMKEEDREETKPIQTVSFPRMYSENFYVHFHSTGVEIFGTREAVGRIDEKLHDIADGLGVEISSRPDTSSSLFYPNEKGNYNVKKLKEKALAYLSESEEYQQEGSISVKAVREALDGEKRYPYIPFIKDVQQMERRGKEQWDDALSQALYSLAVDDELGIGVDRTVFSDYQGHMRLQDKDTIQKETGVLFESSLLQEFPEKVRGSQAPIPAHYVYDVSFSMDNVQMKMPNVDSLLPPKEFDETLAKVNKEIRYQARDASICATALDHQHWAQVASGCLKECCEADEKRYAFQQAKRPKVKNRNKARTISAEQGEQQELFAG